ncbi:DUF4247 domain-containing protein [Corynebacterium uterequi]
MGVLLIIFGLAAGTKPRAEAAVSSNYERIAANTYRCHDTPSKVADDLEKKFTVRARSTDDATGTVYLRAKDRIVSISGTASDCQIRVEDLGRYHNGGFIFLGPGFAPPAPSGSSGGSSGASSGSGGSGVGSGSSSSGVK